MTQSELAERVGATRQTIGLIESGNYNPSLKLCIELALALETDLNSLFWYPEEFRDIFQHSFIIVTDIGSTTTKGLLLKRKGDSFEFFAEADVPTTVESPDEDVCIGLKDVISRLSDITGVSLLEKDGHIKVPYITTSSAGGGLQIIVFGLSEKDTGRAAEVTAHGAGGVILRTFTIDDSVPVIEKMRILGQLHPDMVLMAGGMDGGNIAALVRLSEILSISEPTPKFHSDSNIPLVFCGNKDARQFISSVLNEKFDVHIVPNIRPNPDDMNTGPARAKIHELFMENVMERAPGYSKLKKQVKKNIVPTPSGVEKILREYSEKITKNVILVDIGGATTDIFTNIWKDYYRTVAANTGMSYSISNILAEGGVSSVKKHLPVWIEESDMRNYISNKALNPTYVPKAKPEVFVEHATAISGISQAWKRHIRMNFQRVHIGFLDRLKKRVDVDHFQEVFYGQDPEKTFQTSDIDIIIGAGGVLSHAPDPEDNIRILTDSFMPVGITKLVLDKNFKSPHMGVLCSWDRDVALELYSRECLEELALVIVPTGKIERNREVMRVKRDGREYILEGGDILYLKEGGIYEITLDSKFTLNNWASGDRIETELPVLFDCRGRGDSFSGKSLIEFHPWNENKSQPFISEVEREFVSIERGNFSFERSLPYEGEIFLTKGDKVSQSTILGQNTYAPPKIYILDIHSFIGYDKEISPEEIDRGIQIEVGELIDIGQVIFTQKTSFLGESRFRSSVRGFVTDIQPGGLIIVREIQDYSDKPVKINVSGYLQVNPKHIKNFLRFSEGDFVHKGQILSNKIDKQVFKPLTAPSTGMIKEIDTTKGTMTIQYDIDPKPLHAFVAGTVTRVSKGHGVTIEGHGTIIKAIIGFGGENFGQLSETMEEGKVVYTENQIDKTYLLEAEKKGIKGIIAPSISEAEWVSYIEKEMGVALTGDEDIPYTLILTEGFGKRSMNSTYLKLFRQNKGKTVSLSGRTQIRAGVTRPEIIIPD